MADDIKRLNYFDGQFLDEIDFNTEQSYFVGMQRDHVRSMHTPGAATGLDVPKPSIGASTLLVHAGQAFDDLGRRCNLANDMSIDVSGYAVGVPVYVSIKYNEQLDEQTDETGASGYTRWKEAATVAAFTTDPTAGGNPNHVLILAV